MIPARLLGPTPGSDTAAQAHELQIEKRQETRFGLFVQIPSSKIWIPDTAASQYRTG